MSTPPNLPNLLEDSTRTDSDNAHPHSQSEGRASRQENLTPIFVVGLPRSGTTLLATILNRHPRIACGPETRFFEQLSDERIASACAASDWPITATRLIESLELVGQPVHGLFGRSLADIAKTLSTGPRTPQALIESLTQVFAHNQGKPRWAEKTPNHLKYLERIRRLYPSAPIVRIIRDPRDAASSLTKLPHFSPSSTINALELNRWHGLSHRFFSSDPNTLSLRYEDLITDSRQELSRLCRFLGEECHDDMLAPTAADMGLTSPNEPWKRGVTKPLDTTRLYRWKRTMSQSEACNTTMASLDVVDAFGYDTAPVDGLARRDVAIAATSFKALNAHRELIEHLAEQGFRGLLAPAADADCCILLDPGLSGMGIRRRVRFWRDVHARLRQRQTVYILGPRNPAAPIRIRSGAMALAYVAGLDGKPASKASMDCS
jgi:hypothetical protein